MGSTLMDRRGEESGFWWRVAEPIPAKPERLDIPADDEPDSARDAPAAKPGTVIEPRAAQRARTVPRRDLGALRPGAFTRSERVVGRVDAASSWSRTAMLVAGLAGAIAFGASTEFGRHVREHTPIGPQIDAALVMLGLGIDEISLDGHKHTPDKDIFTALGATGTTLLRLDLEAARRRIEALPWVAEARLSRQLPGKLKVEIRERTPAALWLDGERTALVDASGRVLGYLGTFVPPELPRISGEGAPEAAGALLTALAGVPNIKEKLAIAHRIGGRRWTLELADGLVLKLAAGHPGASLERLLALDGAGRLLARRQIAIDLTVPGAIAIVPLSRTPGPAARAAHDAAGVRPL